ncbi:hypothetical protein Syun_006484 [Stephania yunnanensis]|uniref:Serine incorporator n=1 Tax=Stephania yunnanensis TaxID=152371 RepID=A0AAP0KY49_9MAGN
MVPLDEPNRKRKRSQKARFIYGSIFLLMNLMAWFARDYGHKFFPNLHYFTACGNGENDCSHTMGVLRVSFGCFIFFSSMFLSTVKTSKLYEARNSWHSNYWSLKIVLLIISLAISFFCPPVFIQLYGEVARIGAGVFLLLQLVSVIHFISWMDNYWMPEEKLRRSCFLGLCMSTIFYIASISGIVLMYLLYVQRLTCAVNIVFITWTAVLFLVVMIVTLHSKANKGLLSSGMIGLYIIFLCWSAIRSEPTNWKCNPQSGIASNGDWVSVLGFLFAIGVIVMATFSTGIDSKSFKFYRNEVEQEYDIPYKYGFFHMVFTLGAMYFAMLFVNWHLHRPTQKWIIDYGWASTWVKIINEWLAVTIYLWKLIYPVARQTRIMDHEMP